MIKITIASVKFNDIYYPRNIIGQISLYNIEGIIYDRNFIR
jgi:hypothetical protein